MVTHPPTLARFNEWMLANFRAAEARAAKQFGKALTQAA